MAIKEVTVTVNGTTVTATKGSDDTYTATLASPNVTSYNVNDGHYYPVTVKATNMAGTSTTVNDTDSKVGTSLRLFVRELSAPTITVSSPTSGQYFGSATPTFTFTITDQPNGSGVSLTSLVVTIDSETYSNTSTGVTVTSITNGYSVSVVPTTLNDGKHTFKVQVSDNDGNQATSSTINFTTDTIAPTLNVTNPANNSYVGEAILNVTGTTSDSTSGVPIITIALNGTDQGDVTVSNGSFSKAVTLSNGSNTIVVTATDLAGKITTVTRTVTLDTSAPVIASVSITPNPVNIGESYTVTISVTG